MLFDSPRLLLTATGWIDGGGAQPDATVELLVQQSLVQVAAGCDIIAPSDMMDGRVGAIRRALDADRARRVASEWRR